MVIVQANIPFRSAQNNFQVVIFPAFFVLHKINRIVKIYVVVGVAAHETTNVERTAHAEQIGHLVGVFEGEIKGVIAPKTATRHANFIHVTFALDGWHEFVVQKTVVNRIVVSPRRRAEVFAIPTVFVDAVNAVEFHFAIFNKPPRRLREAHVAVLVETAHRSREQQDRVAPISQRE